MICLTTFETRGFILIYALCIYLLVRKPKIQKNNEIRKSQTKRKKIE